jgi:hypothetical protein
MTALNVLALGALQTGHNHTGFYFVEVLGCDLWDRVGLCLDRLSSMGMLHWGHKRSACFMRNLNTGLHCHDQRV